MHDGRSTIAPLLRSRRCRSTAAVPLQRKLRRVCAMTLLALLWSPASAALPQQFLLGSNTAVHSRVVHAVAAILSAHLQPHRGWGPLVAAQHLPAARRELRQLRLRPPGRVLLQGTQGTGGFQAARYFTYVFFGAFLRHLQCSLLYCLLFATPMSLNHTQFC